MFSLKFDYLKSSISTFYHIFENFRRVFDRHPKSNLCQIHSESIYLQLSQILGYKSVKWTLSEGLIGQKRALKCLHLPSLSQYWTFQSTFLILNDDLRWPIYYWECQFRQFIEYGAHNIGFKVFELTDVPSKLTLTC